MKIVDVNLLLYIINQGSPQHAAVHRWWQEQLAAGVPIGFAWTVILGFVRISTNRRAFSGALSPKDALDFVQEWLALPGARIVQETDEHWRIVRELLETIGTAGNLTTDAHLAALAIAHRATLASCDADFLRFRQVRWENPLAAAQPN